MIVDPINCTISDVRHFDTHLAEAQALDLATYINYVRKGMLLVGVTGDEPVYRLGPAHSVLKAAGVHVVDVQNRGSFAFVIQLGYPEKTIVAKAQALAMYSSLDVTVTGETRTLMGTLL